MATVTMSSWAWKHSYDALLSCQVQSSFRHSSTTQYDQIGGHACMQPLMPHSDRLGAKAGL